VESKGLGQHVDKFIAQEPAHGEQVHKLTLPDTGSIKVEATISQFEGISAHLSFDEFARVLETMLVTWDGYRRGYTKSHAHAEMTARSMSSLILNNPTPCARTLPRMTATSLMLLKKIQTQTLLCCDDCNATPALRENHPQGAMPR
jgi:hypothetical protein